MKILPREATLWSMNSMYLIFIVKWDQGQTTYYLYYIAVPLSQGWGIFPGWWTIYWPSPTFHGPHWQMGGVTTCQSSGILTTSERHPLSLSIIQWDHWGTPTCNDLTSSLSRGRFTQTDTTGGPIWVGSLAWVNNRAITFYLSLPSQSRSALSHLQFAF